MRFNGNPWEYWDAALQDPNFRLKVRFGRTYKGDVVWSDWKVLLIARYKLRYIRSNVNVLLSGFDAGYTLNMQASGKVFSDKLISEMVSEIAGTHELETRIESTSDKFSVHQGTMWDGNFIVDYCLSRAYNASGRSDYLFYVENGDTLVFEPPDLQKSAARDIHMYLGEVNIEAGEIRVLDVIGDRAVMASTLSLSNKVLGWDPDKKTLISVIADDSTSTVPKLSDTPPGVPASPCRVIPTVAPFDVVSPNTAQVSNLAQNIWSRNSSKYFTVPLTLNPGDPSIRVGDVINLDVSDPDGNPHFTTGKYLVHQLDNVRDEETHDYLTEMRLVRRTYQSG